MRIGLIIGLIGMVFLGILTACGKDESPAGYHNWTEKQRQNRISNNYRMGVKNGTEKCSRYLADMIKRGVNAYPDDVIPRAHGMKEWEWSRKAAYSYANGNKSMGDSFYHKAFHECMDRYDYKNTGRYSIPKIYQ